MAQKASAATVAADMRPPDFRKGVQNIRGAIVPRKDKIASINGEISDQWAKIEGLKINKKAAKIFAMLDKLGQEERNDIFRSLNGLVDAAAWEEESEDLVDKAENNVVKLRFGETENDAEDGNREDGVSDDEAFDRQLDDAVADDKAATVEEQAAARKAKVKAIDKARSHLGTTDAPEPFTGDNSDLAGE